MRDKLNFNGLGLSVQSPFVSCHFPGVTFAAVCCGAEGLASGSLQSQQCTAPLGHCCEQLEEGPEASTPGHSNPFGSSDVLLVPWVGDGLVNCLRHHSSAGNKWESITIRRVTALTLSFSEVLFCFGPGVMFSWAAKADVCAGAGRCKQGWGAYVVSCPWKRQGWGGFPSWAALELPDAAPQLAAQHRSVVREQ